MGSIEGAARMLQTSGLKEAPDKDPVEIARSIVEEFRETKRIIPGIGHPITRMWTHAPSVYSKSQLRPASVAGTSR